MDEVDEEYLQLLNASFRFLSFRLRSEKEIKQFLFKKAQKKRLIDISVVDKVIDRLRDLGYVDDKKFASWLVEQRRGRKPKGARAIAQELKAKGVAEEMVEEVLSKSSDEEHETATRAVQKKLPLWSRLPILARKKRLYDFLGRRGFSSETIYRVIDEVVGREVE